MKYLLLVLSLLTVGCYKSKVEVGTCGRNTLPGYNNTYSIVTSVIDEGSNVNVIYTYMELYDKGSMSRSPDDYSTRYKTVDCREYERAVTRHLERKLEELEELLEDLEEKVYRLKQ